MATPDKQPLESEQVRQSVTSYVQGLPPQGQQVLGQLAQNPTALSAAIIQATLPTVAVPYTGELRAIEQWAATIGGDRFNIVEIGWRGVFVPRLSIEEGSGPSYEDAINVCVQRTSTTGQFTDEDGDGLLDLVSVGGWLVFKVANTTFVWACGMDEPAVVGSFRKNSSLVERLNLERLISVINGFLNEANGRIGDIPYAAEVEEMLETQDWQNYDDAVGLLRVSAGLHLYGGEIFDLREDYPVDDILKAFVHVDGSGSKRQYIEDIGEEALRGGDRTTFVAWSRMFWNEMAKLPKLTRTAVEATIDHNKGYNRGIDHIRNALRRGDEGGDRSDILMKALTGPEAGVGRQTWESSKIGAKVMDSFFRAGMIKSGTTYAEVMGLLRTHAALIKEMLGGPIDEESLKEAMELFGIDVPE